MNARHALAVIAVAFGTLAALSVGVLPADAQKASATPAPTSGRWQIVAHASSGDYLSGSFTVTDSSVAAFHGTIQTGAPAACGTGAIRVTGTQKIVYWVSNGWIVGKGINFDHSAAAKVTANAHGKTIKGLLSITFVPPAAAKITGSGTIGSLTYGACELTFHAAPS